MEDITELIGCTAILDDKGNLQICPDLKVYKMGERSGHPEYRVIGDDNNGNILLTSDGLFVSCYPKEKIKILK